MGTSKHSKLKENPSKLQEKTLKTQEKPLKTQGKNSKYVYSKEARNVPEVTIHRPIVCSLPLVLGHFSLQQSHVWHPNGSRSPSPSAEGSLTSKPGASRP